MTKKMPENEDKIDLEEWDLHRAAKENRVDIARALIARGDDVNALDADDWTPLQPLYVAAWHNSTAVARLLIEHGADVDAKGEDGLTPLYWTAQYNFLDFHPQQLTSEQGLNRSLHSRTKREPRRSCRVRHCVE